MKRLFVPLAGTAFAAALLINAPASAQTTATPPPAPPAPNASAAPHIPIKSSPTPNPKATPAPPKDTEDANRVGISGVWEVAIQRPDGVVYTHFKLTQSGNILTGQYLDDKGKKYPLSGTIDGKTVKVIVTMPGATSLLFSGSEDGGTDMVGTLEDSKDTIGFTAAYRPKYKWIDNLTPGSGGLGNPGGPGGGIPQ